MKFAFVLIVPSVGCVHAKDGFSTARSAYRSASHLARREYEGLECKVTAIQVPSAREIDYDCLPDEIFHFVNSPKKAPIPPEEFSPDDFGFDLFEDLDKAWAKVLAEMGE